MFASGANHRLQPRCQEPFFAYLQRLKTDRAQEQVRQNAGKAKHPEFEIASGKVDWTSLFERANRHAHQPEHRVLGFVLRQKPIDQFNQAARANRAIVVSEELHWGIQQIGRLDPHQIPVFFFEKLNSRMCQRF